MKSIPPYFKQESQSTCSLAVLRMVLGYFDQSVSEKELFEKVEKDYGENFQNIWNPTIAKIACEYKIQTHLSALWPILKKNILAKAIKDYKTNPEAVNINDYENTSDKDTMPEPLDLAYEELFKAIELGCTVLYGQLTRNRIHNALMKEHLIQTSIKLEKMYIGAKKGFHSLLLYDVRKDTVFYHDPFRGSGLHCTISHLLNAAGNVGAFIIYKGNN